MADATRIELAWGEMNTAVNAASFALNQSTDALEVVFQVPEDITITRLGFRQGGVTGSSPVYAISLQGVDSSGNPNGTDKTGASTTFTPVAGDNGTFLWKTLGSSYSAVRGEWLCLVIKYSSGTIDGSNFATFGSVGSFMLTSGGTPYVINNDNGTRARQSTSPVFGYGSSGLAYGFPYQALITTSFNSSSTPDERGVKLTIPSTWWDTYKIAGVRFHLTLAASGAFDIILYDTDGTTILQSISIDTDFDRASTTAQQRVYYFDETTLSTLSSGSAYRLTVLPTTGSLTATGITMTSSADLEAYPFGSNLTATSRTNAGAWTDDASSRYLIHPILADITAPSGGSSGTPAFAYIG